MMINPNNVTTYNCFSPLCLQYVAFYSEGFQHVPTPTRTVLGCCLAGLYDVLHTLRPPPKKVASVALLKSSVDELR